MNKFGLMGGLVAAVPVGEAFAPAPAAAGAGDSFVGGLVGGIIGGAIAGQYRSAPPPRTVRRTTTRKPKAVRIQRANGGQREASPSSGSTISVGADPFAPAPTPVKNAP